MMVPSTGKSVVYREVKLLKMLLPFESVYTDRQETLDQEMVLTV